MGKWLRKILLRETFLSVVVGLGGTIAIGVIGSGTGIEGAIVVAVLMLIAGAAVFRAAIDMLILVRKTLQTGKKPQKKKKKKKKSKIHSFKSWLPINKREEILGDLFEIKEAWKQEGYSQKQINNKLRKLKISILWNLYTRMLKDWLAERLKISN